VAARKDWVEAFGMPPAEKEAARKRAQEQVTSAPSKKQKTDHYDDAYNNFENGREVTTRALERMASDLRSAQCLKKAPRTVSSRFVW
jgi:hypothetical protein